MTRTGRLHVGTSGFAYPAWAPRFYPTGTPASALLPVYATRLAACELNSTYYRQPTPQRVAAWADAVPQDFRFTLKAQRGTAIRAFGLDPRGSIGRLVAPLDRFDGRLGAVLFRVPADLPRDDARLAALLQAWPPGIPLTLDLQHQSWVADEIHAMARAASVTLCVTERDEDETPPTVRRTAPLLYLRLRRTGYDERELAAWAERVAPFLAAGDEVYVFFRHDETGESALRAERFRELVARLLPEAVA